MWIELAKTSVFKFMHSTTTIHDIMTTCCWYLNLFILQLTPIKIYHCSFFMGLFIHDFLIRFIHKCDRYFCSSHYLRLIIHFFHVILRIILQHLSLFWPSHFFIRIGILTLFILFNSSLSPFLFLKTIVLLFSLPKKHLNMRQLPMAFC